MEEKIIGTLGKINEKLFHQSFYDEISLTDYEASKLPIMSHNKIEISTKVDFNQYIR